MMDSSTSTMADQLAISLRAWPSHDKTPESLPYLIARINEQRGGFRNITEASLQEEIAATVKSQDGQQSAEEDALPDGPDKAAKGEELAMAREDIIKRVGEAYNTSSQALDLVSLLLTTHAPKVAETTISSYVKQTVPFGSLGAEIMQATQEAEHEETSHDLVGLGWRMRSLTRSADSLLTSATRLEEEMARETTYWQQVLEVKKAGWPLSRLPGDRQIMGVRFGFAEAHAELRDRGLAALRRDPDGSVDLDHGHRWQGEKRLRVRVTKNGRVLAEQRPLSVGDDKTLSQRLLRARDSLFDEELYHELSREARNLVNQEVRSMGGCISFPYDGGSQIEVELIDVAMEQPIVPLSQDSTVPAAIAMSLRLLLSYAHRQNLERRSLPPAPITDTPTARPLYSLLRPILEIIQHQSMRKQTQSDFETLGIAVSNAGLSFTVTETSSSLTLNHDTDVLASDQSTAENLMKRLIRPHHSQMTLSLPNQSSLLLDIHTSVFPPTFGTSFQLTTTTSTPDSAITDMPRVMHFQTVEELQKHISYVTSLDLAAAILATAPGYGWTQSSRYQAELQRKNAATSSKDRLSISVESEILKIDWACSGKAGSWLWMSNATTTEDRPRSLLDTINGLLD
ncbi:MAG: hypothetical protein Q9169_007568 [Polycauliona sp. 2 TL-2023]